MPPIVSQRRSARNLLLRLPTLILILILILLLLLPPRSPIALEIPPGAVKAPFSYAPKGFSGTKHWRRARSFISSRCGASTSGSETQQEKHGLGQPHRRLGETNSGADGREQHARTFSCSYQGREAVL